MKGEDVDVGVGGDSAVAIENDDGSLHWEVFGVEYLVGKEREQIATSIATGRQGPWLLGVVRGDVNSPPLGVDNSIVLVGFLPGVAPFWEENLSTSFGTVGPVNKVGHHLAQESVHWDCVEDYCILHILVP